MATIRLPFRQAAATCRTNAGVRCFSSSQPVRDDNNILDILDSSRIANRHPSAESQSQPTRAPTANTPPLTQRTSNILKLTKPEHERWAAEKAERDSYQKRIYRRWNLGDVYAPRDLGGTEQRKWKNARFAPRSDAFDALGMNPVNEYKNFTIMSEFMTEMGRIKPGTLTGLRPKNQRKVAKAIRRAIGLGLMSSVHRHPLVVKKAFNGRFT